MTLESIEKNRERIISLSASYPWLSEMTNEIEGEVDELQCENARLLASLAAARNANPCVDATAYAMEDAKSKQQLVWTMEREAREAEERIAELESLVRDMWNAFVVRPYVLANPEVLADRMRELGIETESRES